MFKKRKLNKEEVKKEKKNKGIKGEVFVKGMALVLALLIVGATASSLIYAIVFA